MNEEIQEETQPVDEYDLSALYLLIGLDFLVPHGEKIDLVGTKLRQAMWMIVSLVRVIRKLNEELEQRKRQALNLEKRVFDLEEKPGRKHSTKYKVYSNE